MYVVSTLGLIKADHHSKSLDGAGGESMKTLLATPAIIVLFIVPPSPPSFSPIKLEPAEKQELNYMPLRDDFEKVSHNA